MSEKKYRLSTSIDVDVVAKLKMEALRRRMSVSSLLEIILKEKYRMDRDKK